MGNISSTMQGELVKKAQDGAQAKLTKDSIAKIATDSMTKTRSMEQNTTANSMKVAEEATKSIQF
jgi:hypothetical protein